ncbi:Hypothetical predicted protein [Mytilus galloprovincialis]|uniref:Uncharacterized protein n=1 Tax=Mytilus galloprovincialis TaxID=29158 RepID=A0A8B6BGH4_MYTGA|nr:Hypothetical predicted protein [Mytilus galloprovincialis]
MSPDPARALISTANIVFANIPTRPWSLDNKTFTTEIQESSTDVVDTDQCTLTFGSQPLDYPNPVVELDGLTPVDLVVDETIDSGKHYSFSMMVRPTNDTGGYIYMERNLNTESEISPPLTQIRKNTLNFITLGINFGGGDMGINFNGETIQHNNNYCENVEFVIPGLLRVGDIPDCSTPQATQRTETAASYFMKKIHIQLSALYDSSVTFWEGTGAGNNFLYKWN